ncbi:hypothetical protein EVAR_97303_1 [Eumeta japonica]|uniref:Uncharacterized protein n=1 Tax=Eumeta variegata TaxID=151549 RepID=A0A4C1XD92_EUMVA|nr:hypothetical protein EVAR_97303_1 [Eumeta japonica]
MNMHFAFFVHERLFANLPHPFCGCRCGTEDLLVASCPGVFSSGIRLRRSSSDGPISGVQILKFPESAGDPEELSMDTPSSCSTVTAGSGSDVEVVGRRSVRTGENRRWRTSTIQKNMTTTHLRMSVRSWVFLTLFTGAGAGRRTYICLMPRRLLVGDTTPTDQVVMVPFRGDQFHGHSVLLISLALVFGRRCSE